MKFSALRHCWPFSTQADVGVDAADHHPSAPQSRALSDVSESCPELRLVTASGNTVAAPWRQPLDDTTSSNPVLPTRQAKPRRPRKTYKVGSLENRETLTTAQLQAAVLLCEIVDAQPQRVGEWIRHEEIQARYTRLANSNNWVELSWIPIAIALKEWTTSERITRHGDKRMRYRIPRITPKLRRRANLVQIPTVAANLRAGSGLAGAH